MKTVKAQPVSNEVLKGLGRAIRITADLKPDAQSDIQKYYGQLAVMPCASAVQIGICIAKNRDYIVEELEQHAESAELLAALKGDFIVPAAPSMNVDGKAYPDTEKAIAVRVSQGEGVYFEKGVWHWTPYALTPTCDVLVIFKKDTPKNDFTAFQLDVPIRIEL